MVDQSRWESTLAPLKFIPIAIYLPHLLGFIWIQSRVRTGCPKPGCPTDLIAACISAAAASASSPEKASGMHPCRIVTSNQFFRVHWVHTQNVQHYGCPCKNHNFTRPRGLCKRNHENSNFLPQAPWQKLFLGCRAFKASRTFSFPVNFLEGTAFVSPSLASPSLASPSLASPSLASPSLASPSLASPSSWKHVRFCGKIFPVEMSFHQLSGEMSKWDEEVME